MQITKRILSLLLAFAMVLSLLPTTASASTGKVYISVSYDGTYIDGATGNPIAYIPVSFSDISSIDLDSYGLGEYMYDENGDSYSFVTAAKILIERMRMFFSQLKLDVNDILDFEYAKFENSENRYAYKVRKEFGSEFVKKALQLTKERQDQ